MNLIHTKGYKTFSDLSNYTARIEGDFAIHLVTSNHVVAIYRIGNDYAYFDSNTAFGSGLKSDLDSKNVEKVIQATRPVPFEGSKREVEEAEQTRKPKQSLLELAKGTINYILAAVSLTSASRSEGQLQGKTDDKPRTCLNDPTVNKQLQRSCQTISSLSCAISA